jgi:hypothetical protein
MFAQNEVYCQSTSGAPEQCLEIIETPAISSNVYATRRQVTGKCGVTIAGHPCYSSPTPPP